MASGHAVIQVNQRGQNAIVIAGGANRTIADHDRSAARALLEPGDWLLLQNEINDLPLAFEICRDTGAKLAFNLAPVDGREQGYDLACVDLLIVNEIRGAGAWCLQGGCRKRRCSGCGLACRSKPSGKWTWC